MNPRRLPVSAVAVAATAASVLAVSPLASAAHAADTFCSVGATYSGTTIRWTGDGNGHSWSQAANWSSNVVPDAGQTPATYQRQYVCIGTGKGGKPASVTIAASDARHVAGVDVGQGATLTVDPGARLFLGSAKGATVYPSSVDKHSVLALDASALGGNGPLTVSGTLRWTGQIVKGHKEVATQTSSECAFDPSISACPGVTARGGGRTTIAAGGKLLVDGGKFGGTDLTDGRVIDNFGTLTMTGFGYIAMDNGTQLIDEAHSRLNVDGVGGIYRGAKAGSSTAPTLLQKGSLVRKGSGHNVAVLGVPVSFGPTKPAISVLEGSIVLDRSSAPKSPVARAGGYGVGSCALVKVAVCKQPTATSDAPQVAFLGASDESGSPTVSKISVSLAKAPAKEHGHGVLGQAVDVTAPTAHTTHSSHLTFIYDATTSGLKASITPIVYRNGHAITLCRVHGLTAKNTSCVVSEKVAHGGAATKGDLTIVLITIQPDAQWLVAH